MLNFELNLHLYLKIKDFYSEIKDFRIDVTNVLHRYSLFTLVIQYHGRKPQTFFLIQLMISSL